MSRKRKSFLIRDLLELEEEDSGSSKRPFHPALASAQCSLENEELWKSFDDLGTEMIVTKAGRRMFPVLSVKLSGLDETSEYSVLVDFVPLESKRWKYSFHKSKWIVAGAGDAELPARLHLHPDSPSPGNVWTRQPITFDKLKLTNHQLDRNGYIILNSMHRYRPRLTLRLETTEQTEFGLSRSFTFPKTSFTAVTAYQNHRVSGREKEYQMQMMVWFEITDMKIANNPFAKGFRDADNEDWSVARALPTFQPAERVVRPTRTLTKTKKSQKAASKDIHKFHKK